MPAWTRLDVLSTEPLIITSGAAPPDDALWGTSPSGAMIAVSPARGGIEFALYMLWRQSLHNAVRAALHSISYEGVQVEALADFMSAYGEHVRLVELMERSCVATNYVLALEPLHPDVAGLEIARNVDKAQDLARSVAARRAGREALL